MDNLAFTIIAAVILMFLAITGLAIGIILTGKARLRRGCGYTPSSKKKNTTCPICGDKKVCKETKEDEE